MEEDETSSSSAAESKAAESTPDPLTGSRRTRDDDPNSTLMIMNKINAWKECYKVGCTQFGNPHMPSLPQGSPGIGWIGTFHATMLFRAKREARGESQEEDDGFNLDEIHDALDDIALTP
ncbi:hypothetical protein F441_01960 [Phytophthora nicotianae CJ01A1]|uniref:Uncharacterized protein n=1 Tax=Phytophthora nicotianae CJ01A1 TaxID=1317063 RepID=W2XRK8_PHYNI|nr:hypothetical protein F441_01960 [Phytophthora nicotianae CJ01A1]